MAKTHQHTRNKIKKIKTCIYRIHISVSKIFIFISDKYQTNTMYNYNITYILWKGFDSSDWHITHKTTIKIGKSIKHLHTGLMVSRAWFVEWSKKFFYCTTLMLWDIIQNMAGIRDSKFTKITIFPSKDDGYLRSLKLSPIIKMSTKKQSIVLNVKLKHHNKSMSLVQMNNTT